MARARADAAPGSADRSRAAAATAPHAWMRIVACTKRDRSCTLEGAVKYGTNKGGKFQKFLELLVWGGYFTVFSQQKLHNYMIVALPKSYVISTLRITFRHTTHTQRDRMCVFMKEKVGGLGRGTGVNTKQGSKKSSKWRLAGGPGPPHARPTPARVLARPPAAPRAVALPAPAAPGRLRSLSYVKTSCLCHAHVTGKQQPVVPSARRMRRASCAAAFFPGEHRHPH